MTWVRCFRAARRTYIVFLAGICGIPLSLSVVGLSFKNTPRLDAWAAVGLCTAAEALAFLWLRRFRIKVAPQDISIRTLFGREKTVNVADLVSVRVVDYASQVSEPVFPNILVLTDRDHRQIVASLKLLTFSDIGELLEILEDGVGSGHEFRRLSELEDEHSVR